MVEQDPRRVAAVCISTDAALRAHFTSTAIEGVTMLSAVSVEEAAGLARRVAVLAIDDRHSQAGDLPAAARRHPGLRDAWVVMIGSEHHGASDIRAGLTEYLLHHAPAELGRYARVIDPLTLIRALVGSEETRRRLNNQMRTLQRSFLAVMQLSDSEVEQTMIEGIDKALHNPPRERIAAGTVFLHHHDPVDRIWILLSGRVQLFRQTSSGELVLHSHSAGKIIGLIALAQDRSAFHSVRALTDLAVIPLTFEQLDAALQANPDLSVHFVTVLIRSLARRNRRVVELQVEIKQLNAELARERDQLADTLRQLEQTQQRLIESEKLAVLGQLSAGFAHELNNPVSAIQRAADFIVQDVTALAARHPEGAILTDALNSVLNAAPMPTRQVRAYEEELAKALGNAAMARRCVRAGIVTIDEYNRCFGRLPRKEVEPRLTAIEQAHQLAVSLRNIRSAAERVTALVRSLKSQARGDAASESVDIHAGIEDTLMLFSHALRGIEVERAYGDLPPVRCHPGQISQVWTNIIANAIDAMNGLGTLRIETDAPTPETIRVRIIDSGPGIPAEHLEHVFDMRFTTRSGLANFGLGMGLAICRDIVERHGGHIELTSVPGRTCFTVTLPIAPDETLPRQGAVSR